MLLKEPLTGPTLPDFKERPCYTIRKRKSPLNGRIELYNIPVIWGDRASLGALSAVTAA